VFDLPVAETCPDLADDYLDVITRPMDFRTIEEERVPQYTSIVDLQNDLELVFYNCIAFNGPNNELGELARYVVCCVYCSLSIVHCP
jgi:Bromodomain